MTFKKNSIIITLVIMALAATLVLTGCSSETAAPTATPVPATEVPTEAPTETPADEPVEEVTVSEAPAEETTADETAVEEPAETAETNAEPTEAPTMEAEETIAVEPEAETAEATENDDTLYAATVDGVGIPVETFVQTATFNRYLYLNQYNQYAQMYMMYGMPLDSLNSQVEAILGEDGKARLGSEAADQVIYDRVLDLEAAENGVEVSEQEIIDRLKQMFGYEDPSDEEEGMLGLDSFNVSPNSVDTDDDKNAAFRTYAEDVLVRGYDGAVSFDFLKEYAKHILLDNKMFASALEEQVFEAEMVNARHILVEDEETANEILAKLEAGEEWAALASEYSLDPSNKDNSGSLGWFGRGVMVSEFENAAFDLEPGEISQPVQTAYGFHLIASDGKELRPLSGTELTNAQDAFYDEWTLSLRSKHEIIDNTEVWMEAVPTEPEFIPLVTDSGETEETVEVPVTAEPEEIPAEEEAAIVSTEGSEETAADEETAVVSTEGSEETAADEEIAIASTEGSEEAVIDEEIAIVSTEGSEEAVIDEEIAIVSTEGSGEAVIDEEIAIVSTEGSEEAVIDEEIAIVSTEGLEENVIDEEIAIVNTEGEDTVYMLNNDAELDISLDDESEEITISNTELDDTVYLLNNDAELGLEETTSEEPSAAETDVENEDELVVGRSAGVDITADEFVNMASLNRIQYIENYNQYAQFYAMFGLPLDDINAQYSAFLGEEGKEEFGQVAFDQLAYYKMLDAEAAEAGITISEADLTDQLKVMFDYTDETETAAGTLGLESFTVGTEETDNNEDEEFNEYAKTVLAMYYGDSISFDFYKEYVRHGMIENALIQKELEGRVFEAEMVNARHILVEDEETAQEVLARIEAGEDWDALAAEYSQDPGSKDNGGSLGWFGKGVMITEFEDAAFALEPGQISDPIETVYGYHIIASDGKEVRPLEDTALESAQNEAAQEWYQSVLAKYETESYPEIWLPLVPTEPAFEPIETEDVDGYDGIPTFSIGTDEEEAETEESADEETVAEEIAAVEAVIEEAVIAETTAEETAEEETAVEDADTAEEQETVTEETTAEEAVVSNIAATVAGEEITTDEFVDMATYIRYQNLSTYNQYAQIYAMFGMPLDEINEYFGERLGEDGKEILGSNAIDQIAYFKMLEIEGAEAGISISDEQVLAELKEIFAADEEETDPADALGLTTFNLSDEAKDEEAELKESAQAQLDEAFDGKISYEFFREYVRHSLLADALIEKEFASRVFEAEMVNARHILVEDEATAMEVIEKIMAGEDWNDLALEYSIDTGTSENGGSLGWFGRGEMIEEFENAAFALEPGDVSAPVQSVYGYHIILSDGKEVRPLEDEALEAAQDEAANEWVDALFEKYDIESFEEVWLPLVPTEPAFEPLELDTEAYPSFELVEEEAENTDGE